jgi:hypothetical protein
MFFFLAFSLQLVLLVPTQTDAERWITVAALPITLSILVLGYFAVKREHKGLFYAFLSGCAIGCAYFIYKVRSSPLFILHPLPMELTIFSIAALHHLPRPGNRLPPRLQVFDRLRRPLSRRIDMDDHDRHRLFPQLRTRAQIPKCVPPFALDPYVLLIRSFLRHSLAVGNGQQSLSSSSHLDLKGFDHDADGEAYDLEDHAGASRNRYRMSLD